MLGNAIVHLQGANVHQQGTRVLRDVSFSMHRGEFVYLIGKSGSGKSSLLKLLYGALPFTEGFGQVAGFDLSTLDRNSIPKLRRKLGIVFQDFNLLMDRNVHQNLMFALEATGWDDRNAMQARIEQVLTMVGMMAHIQKMPNTLSGGEQQRLVIARALLNQPELIIADEPTGNLDPDTSDELLQLLRQLSKQFNTAILFATHDYRILESFPARILRCQHEHVVEEEDFELS